MKTHPKSEEKILRLTALVTGKNSSVELVHRLFTSYWKEKRGKDVREDGRAESARNPSPYLKSNRTTETVWGNNSETLELPIWTLTFPKENLAGKLLLMLAIFSLQSDRSYPFPSPWRYAKKLWGQQCDAGTVCWSHGWAIMILCSK